MVFNLASICVLGLFILCWLFWGSYSIWKLVIAILLSVPFFAISIGQTMVNVKYNDKCSLRKLTKRYIICPIIVVVAAISWIAVYQWFLYIPERFYENKYSLFYELSVPSGEYLTEKIKSLGYKGTGSCIVRLEDIGVNAKFMVYNSNSIKLTTCKMDDVFRIKYKLNTDSAYICGNGMSLQAVKAITVSFEKNLLNKMSMEYQINPPLPSQQWWDMLILRIYFAPIIAAICMIILLPILLKLYWR